MVSLLQSGNVHGQDMERGKQVVSIKRMAQNAANWILIGDGMLYLQ